MGMKDALLRLADSKISYVRLSTECNRCLYQLPGQKLRRFRCRDEVCLSPLAFSLWPSQRGSFSVFLASLVRSIPESRKSLNSEAALSDCQRVGVGFG